MQNKWLSCLYSYVYKEWKIPHLSCVIKNYFLFKQLTSHLNKTKAQCTGALITIITDILYCYTLSKQNTLRAPHKLMLRGLIQYTKAFLSRLWANTIPTVMAAGSAGGITIVTISNVRNTMMDKPRFLSIWNNIGKSYYTTVSIAYTVHGHISLDKTPQTKNNKCIKKYKYIYNLLT